ncbi:tetratricopeptide repeat protein [Curvivirga aplysinae]|uniref:tetratricopeptide repeat protein n=1 Tax=Curvivirga aplysinae TaxID=2529852 RepID=UPI0012BD3A0F|nr:glycosyltransferase [Curvivirga aplysinae]MTI10570.1 glycosyltransferase family 1 protein [Curvivirga aplysinae]
MPQLSIEDIRWAESALQYLAGQDLNAAMEKISAAQVDQELQPIKTHLLGLLSIRMNNFSEALKLFKLASDISPMGKIHFEAASYCATRLGMLSDSVFYLKMSATCPEPTEFEVKLLPEWLGSVEDQLANIQERPFLQKAKETLANEQYTETLQHLQQALNADPFHVESWLVIQKVMKKLDRKYDSVHAVKAALDSGDVNAIAIAEAALVASHLSLPEANELFQKAHQQNTEHGNAYDVELYELEALEAQVNLDDLFIEKKRAYLEKLNGVSASDKIVALENQVNLGVFSGRLNAGQGADFFVNFILDVLSFGRAPWLAVKVFSNSDYDDFQSNRLKTNARDFRHVDMIDPLTLSRIIRNEAIHILWDFDGLRSTGGPQIHQEIMIPYRLTLDETSISPLMTSLVGEDKFDLDFLPIALPRKFDPSEFEITKDKDRKVILLSVSPSDLTDEILDMFYRIKTELPFFDLLLDTRKLGGVSFVDRIEAKFIEKGLGNFIQFHEVCDRMEAYNEALYSKADYLLTNSRSDGLQAVYNGFLHNCNILVLESGINTLVKSSLVQIGLENRYFDQVSDLENIIRDELESDASFVKTLTIQHEKLIDFVSAERRFENVQAFIGFIETSLSEIYNKDDASGILMKDGK